jgi:beta-1,4-mannosyl-glycoprotein beta-1,4-N-acetylglucosaminyltransferase
MLIDAFTFFNELELLDIRLHELDSIVDYFVIAESLEHHGSIGKKPANLRDNWHLIKPFEKKIKYVVLDSLYPALAGREQVWPRENFQRNALLQIARSVSTSGKDILMISDADEIPRANMIAENIPRFAGGLYGTQQDLFYYNVNTYFGEWHGTVISTIDCIEKMGGPQAARNRRDELPLLENAGWHFSYFGGVDKIVNKVANFAHAVDDSARDCLSRGKEELAGDVAAGRDLYRRPEMKAERREANDPRLPAYFLNNPEKFPQFIA